MKETAVCVYFNNLPERNNLVGHPTIKASKKFLNYRFEHLNEVAKEEMNFFSELL